jgi:hypothetical protein
MTIKSQPLDFAVSMIAVAGYAFGTCKSSADIPICSAIARASSSTFPALSLQQARRGSQTRCACSPDLIRSRDRSRALSVVGRCLFDVLFDRASCVGHCSFRSRRGCPHPQNSLGFTRAGVSRKFCGILMCMYPSPPFGPPQRGHLNCDCAISADEGNSNKFRRAP